jgi:hypothetical protein
MAVPQRVLSGGVDRRDAPAKTRTLGAKRDGRYGRGEIGIGSSTGAGRSVSATAAPARRGRRGLSRRFPPSGLCGRAGSPTLFGRPGRAGRARDSMAVPPIKTGRAAPAERASLFSDCAVPQSEGVVMHRTVSAVVALGLLALTSTPALAMGALDQSQTNGSLVTLTWSIPPVAGSHFLARVTPPGYQMPFRTSCAPHASMAPGVSFRTWGQPCVYVESTSRCL